MAVFLEDSAAEREPDQSIKVKRSDHLARIERESGVPELARTLTSLPPTNLQSLLLEVYRLRSGQRRPAELLAEVQSNRLVRPGTVPPLCLARWEALAFGLLSQSFEAIELSSCSPLGTSSVVAAAHQHRAVSTCRNIEVVSAPTNVLALLCFLRRRTVLLKEPKSTARIDLAARHLALPRSWPAIARDDAVCGRGSRKPDLLGTC